MVFGFRRSFFANKIVTYTGKCPIAFGIVLAYLSTTGLICRAFAIRSTIIAVLTLFTNVVATIGRVFWRIFLCFSACSVYAGFVVGALAVIA